MDVNLKRDDCVMFEQIIAHDIIFEGRALRLSIKNDITERLKAEESLKKSEANLQTILNTTDTAYVLFDNDLKVLAFNDKAVNFAKEQYGRTLEKGGQLFDHFPQVGTPKFINFTKDVLRGNNINYELEYPRPDGFMLCSYVRLCPITEETDELLVTI